MTLTVIPMTFRDACTYVDLVHRHHHAPQGHKFSLGVLSDDVLVGVAIAGRPVARAFDDGFTIEITRLATDGTPNACSALYGAAWRTAKASGHRRAITYTQHGENGASLRASGGRPTADRPPRAGWDTPSRPRHNRGSEHVARTLWEATTNDATPLPLVGNPTPRQRRSAQAGRRPHPTAATGRSARNNCAPRHPTHTPRTPHGDTNPPRHHH